LFVQNFIKLSAAVHKLLCLQRKTKKHKNMAAMLKTILSLLLWAATATMPHGGTTKHC